jgi:hypothetical protein
MPDPSMDESLAELNRLAMRMAEEFGKSVVRIVPGVQGVGITFVSDANLPGLTVCADGKLNSDTLLELVEKLCEHAEKLACKMRGKGHNGRVDQSGQDSPTLGKPNEPQPLADGDDRSTDEEVLGEDRAAEEGAGEPD